MIKLNKLLSHFFLDTLSRDLASRPQKLIKPKENNIRSNCNVFLLFLLLFQNCRECSSQISVFFFWAWSYPMLRDSFEPRRIYYFTFSSEFTAVLTLLVSAARCWIKQSVDNVYIRPPNTDSQSRGSRLSIRPAGRHGARQAMVFVLFCWRLDLEHGGRNTASHQ